MRVIAVKLIERQMLTALLESAVEKLKRGPISISSLSLLG